MLKKIVSGGQTGADRAALDAGLESEFSIGGYCPEGRLAEDGIIDQRYPLKEFGNYRQRTRKNVEESDGTVVFYDSILHGGTELTVVFCIEGNKPYKLIDISFAKSPVAIEAIFDFISQNNIKSLNVAGPRSSSCSTMYNYVHGVVSEIIARSV